MEFSFILTQVLQYVDNCQAALGECRRILKPGGTLLATVPTLSRIGLQSGVEGDFWRFTGAGAGRLFSCVFDARNVEAQAHGNVLTGLAFWVGYTMATTNWDSPADFGIDGAAEVPEAEGAPPPEALVS